MLYGGEIFKNERKKATRKEVAKFTYKICR